MDRVVDCIVNPALYRKLKVDIGDGPFPDNHLWFEDGWEDLFIEMFTGNLPEWKRTQERNPEISRPWSRSRRSAIHQKNRYRFTLTNGVRTVRVYTQCNYMNGKTHRVYILCDEDGTLTKSPEYALRVQSDRDPYSGDPREAYVSATWSSMLGEARYGQTTAHISVGGDHLMMPYDASRWCRHYTAMGIPAWVEPCSLDIPEPEKYVVFQYEGREPFELIQWLTPRKHVLSHDDYLLELVAAGYVPTDIPTTCRFPVVGVIR